MDLSCGRNSMREDKYEIEGLAPDRFDIYVARRGQPRIRVCTAPSEAIVKVIVIALMELEKNSRGIDWGKP
jgi:hypothetical protein